MDFSFVAANHPTVTGTNRNLIAKGNLGVELRNTSRPGYEGESLVLTWVNGSGSARLVVPPGKVLPGDVIRVWMHYDGPPLPASLPTSTYSQQAKFSYTSLVRHIVKPVDQQYVALSCDTDGAYAATYRYGFNGQQKDDEMAGKGNHNTALFWEYDTRLGRRWNVDPVVKEWESAYATMGGNPSLYADPDGDDFKDKNGNNVKAEDGIVATADGMRITNTNENRNWDYGTWNEETGSYDMHNYDRRNGLSAGDVLAAGDIGLASQMPALSTGNLTRKAAARTLNEGSYVRNIVESDGWGGFKMTGIVAPVNDKVDRAIQDLDALGISGGNGALIVAKAPLVTIGVIKATNDAASRIPKLTGWVKRTVFNSLDPAIRKKVIAAIEKGIVAPTGKQGVIKLTESEAKKEGFLYKIKILGNGGDIRIYGNPMENGHILFEKIGGH